MSADRTSGETYLPFSCSQVFGCHSRANRWASATCEAAIFFASVCPDPVACPNRTASSGHGIGFHALQTIL